MWTIYKNKDRIQKFKETEDPRYIYQNKLDKACFQHDLANGDFKNLTRRTAADKILRGKAFKLLKIRNIMDINVNSLQWSINFLIKKNLGGRVKNGNISNKKLSQELYKPVIRKFNKGKVQSLFIPQYLGC